jgi:hypothetical protein
VHARRRRFSLWTELWSTLHNVKTVQVVLDEPLLRAVDREARRAKLNRSELFRLAARQYLERRRIEELERRHRERYERFPPAEFDVWDKVAAWPDD